jgi:translation elongation factor EF-1alpha
VTAVIEVTVDRPICVETSKECKELGRFMLRSGSSVVAAGIGKLFGVVLAINLS